MNSPIDPESVPKELKDGVVASILGGLAMTARLLLSTEPVTLGWVVRRVLAAAITAALVGYGIQDHISSPGLRMAVVESRFEAGRVPSAGRHGYASGAAVCRTEDRAR